MKPLSRHRTNFTWARNEYYKTDDPDAQTKYARFMAKYLAEGRTDGFSVDEITRGVSYPAEVDKIETQTEFETAPSITEEQTEKKIDEAVDTADVIRIGEGAAAVYGYGYACCPDRLKIGYATGGVVQRIAAQIYTSTPDKPALYLERSRPIRVARSNVQYMRSWSFGGSKLRGVATSGSRLREKSSRNL